MKEWHNAHYFQFSYPDGSDVVLQSAADPACWNLWFLSLYKEWLD
jgi:hypothetical protein